MAILRRSRRVFDGSGLIWLNGRLNTLFRWDAPTDEGFDQVQQPSVDFREGRSYSFVERESRYLAHEIAEHRLDIDDLEHKALLIHSQDAK